MAMSIPQNIRKEHVIAAITQIRMDGYPKEHKSTKYDLVYEGRKYPPKWVIRTANIFANGTPLDTGQFSGGKSKNFLKKMGFRVFEKSHMEYDAANIDFETMERERIWRELFQESQGKNIPMHVLRDSYRLYGGSAIWVDKERTSIISNDSYGITVSILQKGTKYPDDTRDDSTVCNYPHTNRRGDHDENEINATKNAKKFNIPIFVITTSMINPSNRDVKKGFVRDWDDRNKAFLIEFGPAPRYTREGAFSEDLPFHLNQTRGRSPVPGNDRNPRFSFDVFKRYGCRCAVCNMEIGGIVYAAHIKLAKEGGTDDPRNGIPLCRNHHVAFEEGYFTIHPEDYQVITRPEGPSRDDLGIIVDDISELKAFPHVNALKWHYHRFLKDQHQKSEIVLPRVDPS